MSMNWVAAAVAAANIVLHSSAFAWSETGSNMAKTPLWPTKFDDRRTYATNMKTLQEQQVVKGGARNCFRQFGRIDLDPSGKKRPHNRYEQR
jgi:hypothetical protein